MARGNRAVPRVTIQELYDLAVQRHQAGQLQDSHELFQQILGADPAHADALHMLGIIAHQTGRPGEAVEWIRRAIAIDPAKAGYHNNLGNALRANGDLHSAIASYREAIARQPNLADAWNNLGNAFQGCGQIEEAVEAHRRALAIRPEFPQAWYGLGSAFNSLHQPDPAIEAFDRAIQLAPEFDAAEVNRANVLRHVGRIDESIEALRRVVQRRPTPVALSNLIYGLYFHPDYDTMQIGEYLAIWNRLFAKPLLVHPQPFDIERVPNRRLRVGYVSPDFNSHPAGRFLLPLLAHHDYGSFEVVCYSDVSEPDAITGRLKGHTDLWREVTGLSDEQLAEQVRTDRIDILVDLTLHLAGNRLLTFARKPAPVQVTWLGYPGSSGLETMDYRLSDPFLDPPGLNDAFYSETTLRLPDCYWCYDPLCALLEVGDLPARRNGFITFGCLNSFAKITLPSVRLWAGILRAVLQSRLVVLAPSGSARTRFLDPFRDQGIDPARIEFVDRQPRQHYMELYRKIDISLDTFPCGGHTTTFDALWMGVPVVSLFGSTAMSRAGLSILSNLGMSDWATEDPHRYVETAIEAAGDLDRLESIRRTLRSRLEASRLMDGGAFARHVEQAYRQMWIEFCKTNPPAGG
ncbi:MAG TPA: tetratricopeptide repeat protein [Tepidisphaeraceae bacterium]|jgi:predicted O-linked N-acetylglucosamine transferase (SPINDLY family)